ncbi:hypothetical protein [Pilimelia columellifera]|uniref:CHAT domain-containing protein n=1 Tax=Pilimelia columellifera subsp. columellifera TaxID=706583 RepID=A0ABN3N7F8_9ACTN
MTERLPAEVTLNAWADAPVGGALAADAVRWGARAGLPRSQQALPIAPLVDEADWAHPDVGYGVLLPDRDDVDPVVRAAGGDAPEPVRRLIAGRPGTVALRWRPDLPSHLLRRYLPDGRAQDPVIGLSRFGVGPGRLPRHVLIVGGPDQIPWSTQYALGVRHAVGRLPLPADQIGSYVDALLAGWPDASARLAAPLVWSVDAGDITTLMRQAVAGPLAAALRDPSLPDAVELTGPAATSKELLTALLDQRPALLVTSSHGRTAPLEDPTLLAAGLGLPVAADHVTAPLSELTAAVPAGTIWHAAACCSAGSDATSAFAGLLSPGGAAHRVVGAVAGLGDTVAPAATALLSRPDPVRAIVGHVEPTFDWTLQVAETGQSLGHELVAAFSTQLHHGRPLGLALAGYWAGVGQLHTDWATARDALAPGDVAAQARLTRLQLTARDRQALVLLGDPTVTLAPG